MPDKLQQLIDTFQMFDPADRTSMLLSYADQFKEVPASIATRPFPKSHQIPQCKALAAILDKTLSGLPASEIATINADIVEKLFRQNISMGKGIGLMSMVQAVQALAKAASQDKS